MNHPPQRVGNFQVLERIGGTTCDVYKGYDAALDRQVAIKILKPELAADLELVHRFHRAATATARVAHPNVVSVHFVGQEENRHFAVMQYIRGQTLASRLTLESRLPLREAVDIARQCLRGLEAAHQQGLVHGNVNPGNVLLERETGRVVLIDFGRGRATNKADRSPAQDDHEGSAELVAPEQRAGQPATPRTDLYCLGAVLYQMLAGRQLPNHDGQETADARTALDPATPESLKRVVERLTAPNPVQRYADCGEALRELDCCVLDGPSEESPVQAAPDSAGEPTAGTPSLSGIPLRRRRVSRRLIELVVVVSVLLVFLFCQRAYMALKKGQWQEDAMRRGKDRIKDQLVPMPAYNPPAEPPRELMSDCVLYLSFERDSVQKQDDLFIVKDLSGKENHGVVYGAMIEEQGKVGNAFRFEGNPDYVSLPTLPGDVVRSGEPVSLSMWVNEAGHRPASYLFSATTAQDCPGIALTRDATDHKFSFETPWKPERVQVEEIPSQVWHHVVGVWDGRSNKIYVDGHLAREKTVDLKSPQTRQKTPQVSGARLGGFGYYRNAADFGFKGLLDEVMLFRRALFAEEVRTLYDIGQKGQRPAALVQSPSLSGFLDAYGKWSAHHELAFDAHLRQVVEYRRTSPPAWDVDPESPGCARTANNKVLLVGHPWGWIIQHESGVSAEKTIGRGQPPPYALYGLVMSPNDRQAACYGATGQVFLWNIDARMASQQIDTSLQKVLGVAFSDDGQRLVVGGKPNRAQPCAGVWDVKTGRELVQWFLFQESGTAVACSRRGDRVLVATMPDKRLHLFPVPKTKQTGDSPECKEIRSFTGHAGGVTCAQFLPGGTKAVSGGADNVVRLWDLETGKEICALKAHLAKITCLAVSADGHYAISGSEDTSVRIWDLERCVKVDEFAAADEPVRYVAFRENPRRMCVATSHGSFYDVPMPISNMPPSRNPLEGKP